MAEKLVTTKAQAGRLGGLATVAKHGQAHMAAIGRRGAAALWARYDLAPAGLAGWALIDRETGAIKRAWNVRHD